MNRARNGQANRIALGLGWVGIRWRSGTPNITEANAIRTRDKSGFANTNCDSILDTAHVPCKFFRQGACQAGSACPFSHDLSTASETICKYFAKVRRAHFLSYESSFTEEEKKKKKHIELTFVIPMMQSHRAIVNSVQNAQTSTS